MIGQGNTQHDDFESENLETNEVGIGATDAGTSFVSSIFSEGMFADPTKRRYLIFGGIGAAILIVFGAAYYFLGSSEPESLPIVDTPPVEQAPPEAPPPAEGMPPEAGSEMAEGVPVPEELPPPEEVAMPQDMLMNAQMMEGAVSIISPTSGQSRDYDQTMGAANFSWDGNATYIVFARNSAFQNPYLRLNVAGRNSFDFQHPFPGRWFWRLEDADTNPISEAASFTVAQAMRRNVALSEPTDGGSLSSGSTVAWSGDEKVAYYRLELTTGNFAMPTYRFSTVNTSMQLADVAAGSYQLRVGAFSEVTGRWEYVEPISVTVQ
ncbi:MAG: hypothetical protein OYH77_08085 [Pseudomonadota bacterium]|nr:hypothetical protein [Pseudomonadota bacterium]